ILLKDREVETTSDVISKAPTSECQNLSERQQIEDKQALSDDKESIEIENQLPEVQKHDFDEENKVSYESKPIELDQLEQLESRNSDSDGSASESKDTDKTQRSKSPDSRSSEPILQPPAPYQTLEQSSDNSDSSNNRTIESSQNSFSDNSQIVPNTVDDQIKNEDQMSDQPDEQINEQINELTGERDQNDNFPSPPTTPSDDTISSEPPKSCLSRRTSSKSSIKKKVNYCDSKEYIPSTDDGLLPMVTDDDEVFSDSISPQLPRGDMCTPYPKKKGSIPGMTFPCDWFPYDSEVDSEVHREPPVTPIGRDELALKQHRFFAELLSAAQAAADHRVRFNPLGPEIAITPNFVNYFIWNGIRSMGQSLSVCLGRTIIINDVKNCNNPDCDPNLKPSTTAELGHLIDRLEKIIERLERTVSARELASVNGTLNAVIQKTDSEELDSLPLPLPPSTPNFDLLIGETVIENYPLLNGKKASIDLENLPTVIQQICSDEYLTQDEPDYSPPTSMSVLGYQDIVSGPLFEYINLSKKIGGDVAVHAEAVEKAFNAQLAYVTLASTSAQPSPGDQQQLLKPTSDQITIIQDFREKNRTSPFFNHLSAISESIPALGWVCVSPTPGPHVKEMNDAGQFYTNRVLKDWKEKDPTHVEWARSWIQTLTELQKYIRQYHTTGLVWSAVGSNDDRSALFAQINQGADITKNFLMLPLFYQGLKKVTSDMQTHKNTALRAGPAPFKAPVSLPPPSSRVPAPVADKPPVFTRDGKKWLIVSIPFEYRSHSYENASFILQEYQKKNPNLLVENAEMNNMVYLFKCEDSVLTVKGKINGIIMDSCKKCSVLFDSVVSSVEFVNCQSVKMQVLGNVPTISIDKTDGCQMYLSDKSLDVEIVSSKSSEMNVLIPKGNGDYTEKPIPEQFKTKIEGDMLTTICVESLG
ncbi:Adenylyl cyclase-associated protein 1, partial [Pseudolycoriella hygida]